MKLWQIVTEGIAMIIICLLFMMNGRENAKDHAVTGFIFGATGFIAFIIYVSYVRSGVL